MLLQEIKLIVLSLISPDNMFATQIHIHFTSKVTAKHVQHIDANQEACNFIFLLKVHVHNKCQKFA